MIAAAAAILAYQLFIPPIVGLADQGDFGKMIGRFGYHKGDRSASLWAFVDRKYVPDPNAREPLTEQATPEYIFVGAAVLLNKLVSKDGKLDIVVMGLVHGLAFLGVFAWLLRVTQPFAAHPLLWIAMLLALTDVGYAAYWNSFYAEPASHILFLLLLAESIPILREQRVSTAQIARWCLWAALWVDAKSSNFPLALVVLPLALRLGWLAKTRRTRNVAILGAVAIAISAAVNMWTRPKPLQNATVYDAVFLAILPESKDPRVDLAALGLDPQLVRFSGKGAWSPDNGFDDMVKSGAIGGRTTSATVGRYYLSHPSRAWRHAKRMLAVAFSLRPEWCGNFEQAAGLPPGARSSAFSLWSEFHQRYLSRWGELILIVLLAAPVVFLLAWIRVPAARLRVEFGAALSLCCLIAFLVPTLGDAWDNVKHLSLFNLTLDAAIFAVVVFFWSRLVRTNDSNSLLN